MPYSPDPEQNKINPYTPSTMPMESQLLYKIGSLESAVHNMSENFKDSFENLRREIIERTTDSAKEVAALAIRVDTKVDKEQVATLTLRVENLITEQQKLKDWKTSFTAKTAVIASAFIALGSLIGPLILKALGSLLHI